MKVLFAGHGTGGHFYPIIAVAEQINTITQKEHLVGIKQYFVAPTPYDKRLLFENNIEYYSAPAGKMRRYFSLLNIFDIFKTGIGIIKAIFLMYRIFPDVVFAKGGYASFPVLFAAHLFGIPIIIHESDSVPGRVNLWAGRFAKRIAVSYPDAAKYFPKEKVALTGNPIRKEIATPQTHGAYEFLKLEEGILTILVLGGSQGSQRINETILDVLPRLLQNYQIIHQTGRDHFKQISGTAEVVLEKSAHKERYHPFPYLNTLAMRMAAGAADMVISRAGSGIFEIAAWELPSIIIPIPESISHDQKSNAFTYARSGACLVIEEENLSGNLLISEVDRFMKNEETRKQMGERAKSFARLDAAEVIAREIIKVALEHEK